jgi:hypothetical protein
MIAMSVPFQSLQTLGAALLTAAFLQLPVLAQFSPKCQLNGKEVFCAMTSYGTTPDGWQRTTVVLSDDRIMKLHYDDKACRTEQGDQVCPARITVIERTGPRSVYGTYRLQRFEGGVTHRYQANGVDLRFFYMD